MSKAQHSTPEYFVVDVEATGPEIAIHSLIEVGMVRADDPEDRFHCFIDPGPDAVVDEWVMENIPEIVARAREEGLSRAEAARRLDEWVRSRAGDKTPILVGYVMTLDARAICDLFEKELGPNRNPFHYKSIDVYPLAMGTLGLPWGFSREDLDEWLGIEALPEHLEHNALHDATQHAKELNALRKLLGPRWAGVTGWADRKKEEKAEDGE